METYSNVHIRQTTYECSAEREIRIYARAERRANATIIACAFAVVGLLIAGVAYAASDPKVSVAVAAFANEQVVRKFRFQYIFPSKCVRRLT